MQREHIYKNYQPAVVPGEAEKPETTNGSRGYWFIFSTGKLLVRVEDERISLPFLDNLSEIALPPLRTQYLGKLEGQPCHSAEVAPDTIAPAGMSFRDLRSTYDGLDEDLFLLAGKAIQIVNWDQTHQYCGRCGLKTETLPGERAKKCPGCGFTSYPRLAPAVITAVIRDEKILLIHYAAFPGNRYTIIAGFVEPGETLEDCVLREIQEETNIKVKNIRYFGSQPWPFPNSLMIGFTAEYESGEIAVDGKEVSAAGWFEADNLPEVPPKLSISREIIDWYREKYRRK
jgi:NAD+ diphosphatase